MVTIRQERQVHYRRSGSGSPVILLHQSPNSSQEYIPLIEDLASKYTVIAPDTPGNGLSDPLPFDSPVMTDFANNVAELMDALGIERCPVYGFHTGAVCALELAWRHPEKVTVSIVDGYVNMPEDLVSEIKENYFVPLEFNWSGSHLTWTWARFREQLLFFPWYRKDLISRMNYTLPQPDMLHTAVIEFLRSGNNYIGPYRAAFTQDNINSVKEMQANCILMATKNDPLVTGLDRMPKPSESIRVLRPDTKEDAIEIVKKEFDENHSSQTTLDIQETLPINGKIWGQYLRSGGGSLYCRGNNDAESGRPVIFIHSSASSSFSMDRYMKPLIGVRPCFSIDLPGNGESDNPMGLEVSVEKQASFLAEAIHALGYDEVDVFGDWGGGTVGVELAVQHSDLVKHIAVPNIMAMELAGQELEKFSSEYTPDISINQYGSHWIEAWNIVRDQELFSPWFERKASNIIRSSEPNISPEVIHRRTLDLFKSFNIYQSAYKAHFAYHMSEKIALLNCPVLLGSPSARGVKKLLGLKKSNIMSQDLTGEPPEVITNILDFYNSK